MARRLDAAGLLRDDHGDPRCPHCDGRLIVPPIRYGITQPKSQARARPPWCPDCGWKQQTRRSPP